MSKTIAEKIFSKYSWQDVKAGDLVIAEVDVVVGTDPKIPMAVKIFESMGKEVNNPESISFIIDHFVPCGHASRANDHKIIRDFGKKNGIKVFDAGQGVCHQLVMESGQALPGSLIAISDSHSASAGALNCFAVTVGSSEFAALMATNKLWFKVPETIKINFKGTVPNGVYGKDIIIHVLGKLGVEGANYKVIEFTGEALKDLDISERITICNMVVDVGAKSAIMEYDEKTASWIDNIGSAKYEPVSADPDAVYTREIDIDVTALSPQVSCPHEVHNAETIENVLGKSINQGFIGSCTNGRLLDLEIAAKILEGKKIHPDVRLIVTPASKKIYMEAIAAGYIQTFIDAGAQVMTPACGPCAGILAQQGVTADGEVIISTSNRNFKGRMGNKNSEIYLASPAVVAASVLYGKISDPRQEV